MADETKDPVPGKKTATGNCPTCGAALVVTRKLVCSENPPHENLDHWECMVCGWCVHEGEGS